VPYQADKVAICLPYINQTSFIFDSNEWTYDASINEWIASTVNGGNLLAFDVLPGSLSFNQSHQLQLYDSLFNVVDATSNMTVIYGPVSSPNEYACNDLIVSNIVDIDGGNGSYSNVSETWTCQLSSGVGQKLKVGILWCVILHNDVTVCNTTTATLITIGYPLPVITSSTLTTSTASVTGEGVEGGSLKLTSNFGDLVWFDGQNFLPLDTSRFRVYLGPLASPYSYNCTIFTQFSSTTRVACRTPTSGVIAGVQMIFTITALNVVTHGNDTYVIYHPIHVLAIWLTIFAIAYHIHPNQV
jgi:hypothetical protein